jgi:hypothetical protein
VPGNVPRPITWTCPTSAQIKALLAEELGLSLDGSLDMSY